MKSIIIRKFDKIKDKALDTLGYLKYRCLLTANMPIIAELIWLKKRVKREVFEIRHKCTWDKNRKNIICLINNPNNKTCIACTTNIVKTKLALMIEQPLFSKNDDGRDIFEVKHVSSNGTVEKMTVKECPYAEGIPCIHDEKKGCIDCKKHGEYLLSVELPAKAGVEWDGKTQVGMSIPCFIDGENLIITESEIIEYLEVGKKVEIEYGESVLVFNRGGEIGHVKGRIFEEMEGGKVLIIEEDGDEILYELEDNEFHKYLGRETINTMVELELFDDPINNYTKEDLKTMRKSIRIKKS